MLLKSSKIFDFNIEALDHGHPKASHVTILCFAQACLSSKILFLIVVLQIQTKEA